MRFLESEGYDVSYVTDTDVDRDPAVLRRHRIAITAGHGEYWTSGIRDAYDTARGVGTNMLFMGANTGYWRVRQRTPAGRSSRTRTERPIRRPRSSATCRPLGRSVRCSASSTTRARSNWPRVGYVTNPYPVGSAWFANTNLAAGLRDRRDREP